MNLSLPKYTAMLGFSSTSPILSSMSTTRSFEKKINKTKTIHLGQLKSTKCKGHGYDRGNMAEQNIKFSSSEERQKPNQRMEVLWMTFY